MNFSYANPTQIHFGQGQIASLSNLVDQTENILLVYGTGSIKSNGIYQQVEQALKNHTYYEFSGIKPNPSAEYLKDAIDLAREKNISLILAIGGGSVIDAAKFIAAAAKYSGDSEDILRQKHQVTSAISLGVILTLPATGSESNAVSVITLTDSQEKLHFHSVSIQPKFAILDPDTMKSLPKHQLINGIVDAWVHICEQYITYPCKAMVQDGYAEVLLKNLRFLANNINRCDSNEWRSNLMWTANQALNGLIGVGVPQDWATHMIGHELTARLGIDHARSLAIIQPSLLRHQVKNKQEKLIQMGRNIFALAEGSDFAIRAIDAIESFYRLLGVETKLTQYQGDKEQLINKILQQLEKHQMTALGERQEITIDNCREILEEAIA